MDSAIGKLYDRFCSKFEGFLKVSSAESLYITPQVQNILSENQTWTPSSVPLPLNYSTKTTELPPTSLPSSSADQETNDYKYDLVQRLIKEIDGTSGKGVCSSFLILGGSGSGKSFLGYWICKLYWEKYMKGTRIQSNAVRVPIHIYLPYYEAHLNNELLEYYLTSEHLPSAAGLPSNISLLLILDGYDELSYDAMVNLAKCNNWGTGKYKDIKVLTLCRSEAVPSAQVRNKLFQFSQGMEIATHQEYHLQPFTRVEISKYIQKFSNFIQENLCKRRYDLINTFSAIIHDYVLKEDDMSWFENSGAKYQQWFQNIPDLFVMAENPYLLTLILQALPQIIEESKSPEQHELEADVKQICKARAEIFKSFTTTWFKYQNYRLKNSLIPCEASRPNIKTLEDSKLLYLFQLYSSNLASSLIDPSTGRIREGFLTEERSLQLHLVEPTLSINLMCPEELQEYFPKIDPNDPDAVKKEKKFIREINLKILRSACLIQHENSNVYNFSHRSLIEYFAANELFENTIGLFDAQLALINEANEGPKNGSLNRQILVEPSILSQLALDVKSNPTFCQCLGQLLHHSKTSLLISKMAANAATILNYAGISFSGQDLSHVQISGANLSKSICTNTNFCGADLSNVNFEEANLAASRFQGCNLSGTMFDSGIRTTIEIPKPYYISGTISIISYSCNELENVYDNDEDEKCIWLIGGLSKLLKLRNGEINKIEPCTLNEGIVGSHFNVSSFGENQAILWSNNGKCIYIIHLVNKEEELQTISLESFMNDSNPNRMIHAVLGSRSTNMICILSCQQIYYKFINEIHVDFQKLDTMEISVRAVAMCDQYLCLGCRDSSQTEQLRIYQMLNSNGGQVQFQIIHQNENLGEICCSEFEPCGGNKIRPDFIKLAIGGALGKLYLLSGIGTMAIELLNLEPHEGRIDSLRFSSDSAHLASSSETYIRITQVCSGQILSVHPIYYSTIDGDLAFSPSNTTIAIISRRSDQVYLWKYSAEIQTSPGRAQFNCNMMVTIMDLNLNGEIIAIGLNSPNSYLEKDVENTMVCSTIEFYNARSGLRVGDICNTNMNGFLEMKFLTNTKLLVIDFSTNYIWVDYRADVSESTVRGTICVLQETADSVVSLQFIAISISSLGHTIALITPAPRRELRIYEIQLSEASEEIITVTNIQYTMFQSQLLQLETPSRAFCCCLFNKNGTTLKLLRRDGGIQLWSFDLNTFKLTFVEEQCEFDAGSPIVEWTTFPMNKTKFSEGVKKLKEAEVIKAYFKGFGVPPFGDYIEACDWFIYGLKDRAVYIYQIRMESSASRSRVRNRGNSSCELKLKIQLWFNILNCKAFSEQENLESSANNSDNIQSFYVSGSYGNICCVDVSMDFSSWRLRWSRLVSSQLIAENANVTHAWSSYMQHIKKQLTKLNVLGLDHVLHLKDESRQSLNGYVPYARLFKDLLGSSSINAIQPLVNVHDCTRRYISKSDWVVSALYSKPSGRTVFSSLRLTEHHAFLIIEGVLANNRRFIIRSELVLRTTPPDGIKAVRIQITPWIDDNIKHFQLQAQHWKGQQWNICRRDGYTLINNCLQDQWRIIKYNATNSNCVTWCKNQLEKIGITMKESWLNTINIHIPSDVEK